eukprot:TRINITY_DN1236_c0_g1_i6.p1 TRINITY_DN1236_c0_g1~~TRINITY_DN1236_c0_g1_i6.p1  ORF type:complete len:243 (-),score=57.48 TRINITY_DN1236_c0_g1_i6:4-732(-)
MCIRDSLFAYQSIASNLSQDESLELSKVMSELNEFYDNQNQNVKFNEQEFDAGNDEDVELDAKKLIKFWNNGAKEVKQEELKEEKSNVKQLIDFWSKAKSAKKFELEDDEDVENHYANLNNLAERAKGLKMQSHTAFQDSNNVLENFLEAIDHAEFTSFKQDVQQSKFLRKIDNYANKAKQFSKKVQQIKADENKIRQDIRGFTKFSSEKEYDDNELFGAQLEKLGEIALEYSQKYLSLIHI